VWEVLRANPGYELVLMERLPQHLRDQLATTDEVVYGALLPRPGSGLEPRCVTPDTALLFLSLTTPGPLPGYVAASLAEHTKRRLVLDDVLQVRDGNRDTNRFVSGPAAVPVLPPQNPSAGGGRTAELSVAALRYGQELRGLGETLLAQRLYAFGRQPVSPRLRRRYPSDTAIPASLDGNWIAIPPDSTWLRWRARSSSGDGKAFKLYVSPTLESAATALNAVAMTPFRGARGFKIGKDLPGLCRPDKLIVYFDRLEELQEAAAVLQERLDGCQAHGVPFTAAITDDALLSWGMDEQGKSWRIWIAERLAEYLCRADGAVEPWRFALERLRAGGVNTATWAPSHHLRAGRLDDT
jgi:hypothetical protein